ncbi:MFS transporter [Streptomyces sannanensis]|uniref:MFS transporter n=1 Tax=Streptomyces sannanensis TaxID=285536 RepID=A0ABP6SJL1_9ACTN
MRKWGPLVAVCLGTFMLLVDVTIVVVALPEIGGALGASLSDMQWVIDAYALAMAALLLGAGAAADVVGRRRLYLAGTGLFATASLACGLATGPAVLNTMRAVQGVGGAAMFATSLSLLGAAYRGRDRSLAFGVWGAVAGASAALGPVLGGVLTEHLDWRWIFFANLPVSAVALWITLRTVTESAHRGARRIDWAGMAAFAVCAGAATFAVVRVGVVGWESAQTAAAFAVSAAALCAFVVAERRAVHPLIDLSLFRRRSFVSVMAGALAFNAAAFGVLPYTSIWLQTLLGLSPVGAGLALLPLAATSFVVAAVSGRLLHDAPPRLVIGGGLLLVGGGVLAQGALGPDSGWPALVPGLLVTGAGVGLVSQGISAAALACVPPRNAGMAGGAVGTFRQLGFALGVAVFGAVATSRMEHSLVGSTDAPAAAARALAGGAARQLAGRVPDGTLHTAFASGLNAAALAAGVTGVLAGLAVLAFVRTSARADLAAGNAHLGNASGGLIVDVGERDRPTK